jgi:hypothetical protein
MATFNFRASPVLLAVTAFIRPLSAIAKWLPQSVSSILEGILERTAIVRHFVRCAGNVKRRCARSLWNRLLPTRESFSFDYVITQFVLATRTFCAGLFCPRLVHCTLLSIAVLDYKVQCPILVQFWPKHLPLPSEKWIQKSRRCAKSNRPTSTGTVLRSSFHVC